MSCDRSARRGFEEASFGRTSDVVRDSKNEDNPKPNSKPILHPDIINHIISFCSSSTSTLFNIALTSKLFYSLVIPELYRFIIVDLIKKPSSSLITILTGSYAKALTSKLKPRPEWYIDPKDCIEDPFIPGHFESQHSKSVPILDLPNLDTLHLSILRKSSIGWSFCKPDGGRYPYYPISKPCCLLLNLQPKHLEIFDVTTLNTPSPFPLPDTAIGQRFWSNIQSVSLYVFEEQVKYGSLAEYKDGFLANLPKQIESLSINIIVSNHKQESTETGHSVQAPRWSDLNISEIIAKPIDQAESKMDNFLYGLRFVPDTCKIVLLEIERTDQV